MIYLLQLVYRFSKTFYQQILSNMVYFDTHLLKELI